MNKDGKLAVNGGTRVRSTPMPLRGLVGQEEKEAVTKFMDECIRSGRVINYNGPTEQQYEKDFVRFMGGGFADGVNSGTNALFCALGALQLEPFSEVVVPPITDPGGVMPVIFLGCVPVPADADPRSYNTSAARIEKVITRRTRAIVVAHIGGEPVEMGPVMALARRHGLPVVEDCAQSHGARYKGKLVGTFGRIAAFSTMSGKHHCTGGQGGVVYTRDEELHWNARRFADRGKPFNLETKGNVMPGLNCNLNDLSAVIGSVQLRKLPGIIRRRHDIGEAVKKGLRASRAVSVGWQAPDTWCVYWFLRLRLDPDAVTVSKKQFCAALAAEGIPLMESYRNIPGDAPWFKDRVGLGKKGFPWTDPHCRTAQRARYTLSNAGKAVDTHFNVSIHENYGRREVCDIINAIRKVEEAYSA